MLRRSDELRGCGISDGSILQVMSKMRGRGMHKNRNGQKEWKNATSPRRPEQNSDEEPKNVKDLLMQECNKEWMIGTLKVPEENQKIIEIMAEGSDAEIERRLQNNLTAGRKVLGCEQSQHTPEMLKVQLTLGESEDKQGKTQNRSRKRKRAPLTRSCQTRWKRIPNRKKCDRWSVRNRT